MITFLSNIRIHRNEEVPTICSHGTEYAIHAFCKSENQNCVPAKGSDKLRSHALATFSLLYTCSHFMIQVFPENN